jgi:tight adherence protein B
MLLLGGVALLLIIGAVAYVALRGNRPSQEEQRLQEIQETFTPEWTASESSQTAEDMGKFREQVIERFDNAIRDQGMAGNIRGQLRKANLKLTVVEYLLLHVILAGGLGFLGVIIFGPVQAAILGVVGFMAPRFYVRIRQNRRLKAFNDQLADILQLWVNALRAGFSVPQAMETVSREAPNPASEEFKRVVAEMSIGVPMETALNNMLSRIDSEDLDLVFTAVNIQREVGGNLAEILDTISFTIRERVRIKGEIKVLTSQGRATGMVIGLLPLGLGVLLMFINPEYMGLLLYGAPRGATIPAVNIPCGWPLLAIGLFMMGIGIAAIRRIVDIEV